LPISRTKRSAENKKNRSARREVIGLLVVIQTATPLWMTPLSEYFSGAAMASLRLYGTFAAFIRSN
jgi:hypothetical protein